MDRNLRAYLVELIGTFFLVFLGAVLVCGNYRPGGEQPVGRVGMALAEGCLLAVLLTATTYVSEGCLNPAVTIMLWVFKRLDTGRTVLLIVVQLAGAALAGWLVTLLFSPDALSKTHVGTPHLQAFRTPEGDVLLGGLLSGILIEVALTFLLTVAILATLFDPRRPRLGGLGAGLAKTACVLIGFGLTGAAVNPARWFGTAIWQPTLPLLMARHPFADHAVYWMGPIVGALLAGAAYTLILPPENTDKVTR
jgi:glycerol uptake facilitator-like aquaporin